MEIRRVKVYWRNLKISSLESMGQFKKTSHKSSLGDGGSNFFKRRTLFSSERRWRRNSEKTLTIFFWKYPQKTTGLISTKFSTKHPLHKPSFILIISEDPVILTPDAECLAVELSLPVLTTKVCADRGSNSNLPYSRQTLYLFQWRVASFSKGYFGETPETLSQVQPNLAHTIAGRIRF